MMSRVRVEVSGPGVRDRSCRVLPHVLSWNLVPVFNDAAFCVVLRSSGHLPKAKAAKAKASRQKASMACPQCSCPCLHTCGRMSVRAMTAGTVSRRSRSREQAGVGITDVQEPLCFPRRPPSLQGVTDKESRVLCLTWQIVPLCIHLRTYEATTGGAKWRVTTEGQGRSARRCKLDWWLPVISRHQAGRS